MDMDGTDENETGSEEDLLIAGSSDENEENENEEELCDDNNNEGDWTDIDENSKSSDDRLIIDEIPTESSSSSPLQNDKSDTSPQEEIQIVACPSLTNNKPADVINISSDEDDSVQSMEDQEMLEFRFNVEDAIKDALEKVELKKQVKMLEENILSDSNNLEADFTTLGKQIDATQTQMIETKKIYDKITGNTFSSVVLEEIDIDDEGNLQVTKAQPVEEVCCDEEMPESPEIEESKPSETKDQESIPSSSKVTTDEMQRLDLNEKVTVQKSVKQIVEAAEAEVKVCGVKKRSKRKVKPTVKLDPQPAVIPRPVPMVGAMVYACPKGQSLLNFWLRGEVLHVFKRVGKSPHFYIRFERTTRRGIPIRDLKQKREGGDGPFFESTEIVPSKLVAYDLPCTFVLPVGSRIIAKFQEEMQNDLELFYAGVVAEPPKHTNMFRYLIFFDDGCAQYVHPNDVNLVLESSLEVWSNIHPDTYEFIKQYIKDYPDRPMAKLVTGQIVSVEWNGGWWVARVIEVDGSLVKMKFENDGRVEWIYRGANRFSTNYERERNKKKLVARRKSKKTVRFTPLITKTPGGTVIVTDIIQTAGSSKTPVAKKSSGTVFNYNKMLSHSDLNTERLLNHLEEFEGKIIRHEIPKSVPKSKEYVPHECSSSCLISPVLPEQDISPLALPFYAGWSREVSKTLRTAESKNARTVAVFYVAPCGKRLRNIDELNDYLLTTQCPLAVDHFCFELAMDCLGEFKPSRQKGFIRDMSEGKEMVPVQVCNAFSSEDPPYIHYTNEMITGTNVNTDDDFLVCCDCADNCQDKSKCACWQLTLSGISFKEDNNPIYPHEGYINRRLNTTTASGIYECNNRCKCMKTCCNKVVQNGLKFPLQVFKTKLKGWGVRPLCEIPEGAFICIYSGEIISETQANEDGKAFGDEYLFELNYIERNEDLKAHFEEDVTDIEDENNSNGQHKKKHNNLSGSESNDSSSSDESGTMKHISAKSTPGFGNKRSRKLKKRQKLRRLYGPGEKCYLVDAKSFGNVGRYINHSCEPNVFVQHVFVGIQDLRFPKICFFTSMHIRAGSELTLDYNYVIGSVAEKKIPCYCATPECRGRLL